MADKVRIDGPPYNAFVTGSRAYGVPRDGSDIDLVVMMGESTYEALRPFSTDDPDSGGFQFGRVNVIPICSPCVYDVWLTVTRDLKGKAPVERPTAKKAFRDALAARDKSEYGDLLSEQRRLQARLVEIDHLLGSVVPPRRG